MKAHPSRLVWMMVVTMLAGAAAGADEAYRASIEKWRKEREERLKAPDGWLTVAGLFWLTEGENRFGSDTTNDIVFPERAPAEIGTFDYRNGKVTVRIKEGVNVLMSGKPFDAARTVELKPSVPGPPDTLTLGDLTFFVHVSGDRKAIRLRDKNSRILKEFVGLRWFPINEAYRVKGTFKPLEKPQPRDVPNILGDLEHYESPGTVTFTLHGQTITVEVLSSGQDRLWLIFRDLTSGKETYPSARFLYADRPKEGNEVVLDFNQAYNPPCAFNPYTTCPLPPHQNRLRVRVEAGEMDYPGHKKATE